MTIESKIKTRSKTHTIYKTKNGDRVPGTTTITGLIDKPALILWANKLGLQGLDVSTYVDETARIGQCGHYLIECWLLKQKPDLTDYTKNQIDAAYQCYTKFEAWLKERRLKHEDFVLSEQPLVSEKYLFGGTIDIAAVINNVSTLIDIKTCKAIYSEHLTQVGGGYKILCDENNYHVDNVLILRIGRTENEGFEEHTISKEESEIHQERFLLLRKLYDVNKRIK